MMTLGAAAARTLRIGLGFVLVGLWLVAARNTAVLATAEDFSAVALKIDPSSASALGVASLARLQSENSPRARTEAAGLARRALLGDAANANALGVIALTETNPAKARRAALQAQTLSRRALPAQLWLIEDAVGRGDVRGALLHYDIALRSSEIAPQILFPILVEAVSDSTLLPPLTDTLARRPNWGGLYLLQLAQSGTELSNIARLNAALLRRRVDPGAAALAALFPRLIAAGKFADAWSIHQTAYPQDALGALLPLDNEGDQAVTTPFVWTLSSGSQAIGGGRLFFAADGVDPVLAQSFRMLPAGRYRLSARVGEMTPEVARSSMVTLSCAGASRATFRLPLEGGSDAADGSSSVEIDIPADCPAQMIVVRTDAPSGSSGWIDNLRVQRL